MARRRYSPEITTYYSTDGDNWSTTEPPDARYKLVVEKVYSFSDYNNVSAFVRDDGSWRPAPDDAPQARVIEVKPLASRRVKVRRRFGEETTREYPDEMRFRLPIRLVDEEIADLLSDIPCSGGLDHDRGLVAADTTFYVSLAYAEEAIARLVEAGWKVVDKAVKVADIESATAQAEETAARAEALVEEARALAGGDLAPEALGRLDDLVAAAKALVADAEGHIRRAERLRDDLGKEPGRSADKALAQALVTRASNAAQAAMEAWKRVREARDWSQEAYARQLLREQGVEEEEVSSPLAFLPLKVVKADGVILLKNRHLRTLVIINPDEVPEASRSAVCALLEEQAGILEILACSYRALAARLAGEANEIVRRVL